MKLGTLDIQGNTWLAPMAGVTDWAFRCICQTLGAAVTVTEMVSSRALVYRDKKSMSLLRKCHLPLHKGGFGRCGGENKNPAGAGASAGGKGLDGEGGEPPSQVLFHF